jgi:putative transposase
VNHATSIHGNPEILNSDQGSQFTSELYTTLLKESGIKISMDGKGRAIDNIFIERLWRTVKYEHVYLHAYQDGLSLYKGLEKYFSFYNGERRHQSLNNETPLTLYQMAA